MADLNNNTQNPPNAEQSVNEEQKKNDSENKEDKKEEEPIPTLEEDYESLKNMHLLRNVMVRMQYGRYPNKKIDAVLARRMDLDPYKFQGTRFLRIIISIMSMFFICTAIYLLLFIFAKAFNLYDFNEAASVTMSLFFLCSCSFAIFNNISVPDEKKLKEAIKERMRQIEEQIKTEKK